MAKNNQKTGDRIAKVIARSGFCSRRQAEELIFEGRVAVNGKIIDSPALLITDQAIKIDGKLINAKEPSKLWILHKPKGFVVSNNDPKIKKNIFELLPKKMPRVMTIGRLDVNTEGLLLLTNNGELSRYIELPKNKWTRIYRARVFGKVNMSRLEKLAKGGIMIDGIKYGAMKVELENSHKDGDEKAANSWLKISLTEGKNREIKKVLEYFGLQVNRLIRISFGPFHLGNLPNGDLKIVPGKILKEALPRNLLN